MKTPNWFLERSFIADSLYPFSLLYYFGHKTNYNFKKLFQKKYPVKTICVGNIMAGGTGKTPIVMELAKYIKNSVIVSRGYKGKFFGRVSKSMNADFVGDEPKLLSNYAPVFVGVNRNKSIESAIKNYKNPTIILDDAFQNPSVKYDVKILVFDGKIGLGNNFVLPAGPLRESLKSGLKSADCVIIIGEDKKDLKSKILKYKNLPVFYATNKLSVSKNPESVVAFAGIGYPDKFFNSLRDTKIQSIMTKSFADHHLYTEHELSDLESVARTQDAVLITTEKDWVRLPEKWQKKVLKTKLETMIEPSFYKWLKKEYKI